MRYLTFRCAFCVLFAFIFANHLNGQHLINATGNTIKDSVYSFEYAIGEIAITTFYNDKDRVTQGLLQPNLKEIAAQAFVLPVKRNVLVVFLNDMSKLRYRFLRTGSYTLLCTTSKYPRTDF